MIEIKDLNKKFGKTEVLKNISLTIESGKVTAIVGPNGSGKTTLIKSVLGLVKQTAGEILVDGESTKVILITEIKSATCRRLLNIPII